MPTWMRTSNYTKGRSGYKVVAIVPHISCCPTIAGIDNTFGPYSSRKVSTHYAVSEDATHQYVSESDTAWSVGNWPWNCKTISIEHVGTTANPPTRKCLERGAELMADIAYRHGWQVLVLGSNVRLHREFAATACPANMDYAWEIDLANAILAKTWTRAGAHVVKGDRVYPFKQIQRGSSGELVTMLQILLTLRAGADLNPDGQFGALTEAWVKKWQKQCGIGQDGKCGKKTWPSLLCE